MEIKYKTRVKEDGSYSTYEALEKEFCCKEMEEAFKKEFIVFGEVDSSSINRNNEVNISLCNPYPEGASWEEMSLKFCPFCAEKIEIMEVEKVKIVTKKKEITQTIDEELEIPIREEESEEEADASHNTSPQPNSKEGRY